MSKGITLFLLDKMCILIYNKNKLSIATLSGSPIGISLFALGLVSSTLVSPLLLPFGMQFEIPEYDPSEAYQPDLPTFK